MPYIKQKDRVKFDSQIDELVEMLEQRDPISPGELNYVVSRMIWKIYASQPSYTLANNMIGALECVKAEFYRRFVAPYEDAKIEQNGDVEIS
jgi:hypothetical protein